MKSATKPVEIADDREALYTSCIGLLTYNLAERKCGSEDELNEVLLYLNEVLLYHDQLLFKTCSKSRPFSNRLLFIRCSRDFLGSFGLYTV